MSDLVALARGSVDETSKFRDDLDEFIRLLMVSSLMYQEAIAGRRGLTPCKFYLGSYKVTFWMCTGATYTSNSRTVEVAGFALYRGITTVSRLFKVSKIEYKLLVLDHAYLESNNKLNLFRCDSLKAECHIEEIVYIKDYLDTLKSTIEAARMAAAI